MCSIPDEVIYIINKLKKNDFKAYIVGGAVRDIVMKKNPSDFDLSTSAKPDDIIQIFNEQNLILNGIKYGTVGININNKNFEITTFRSENSYSDNRHPDKVEFMNSLIDDILRRDFTINALAYEIDVGIIDYVNGVEDINNKVIRTVGEADLRFKEDSLRILRALRFSSTLNFNINEKTKDSILNNFLSLENISKERIFTEVSKMLCGENILNILLNYSCIFTFLFKPLKKAIDFNQYSKYHIYDVWEHTAHVVNNIEPSIVLRLAALFHDLGKPYTFSFDNGVGHFYNHSKISVKIANYILKKYKAPINIIKEVVELVDFHHQLLDSEKSIKKTISKLGVNQVENLLKLQKADSQSLAFPYSKEYVKRIDNSMDLFYKIINSANKCFSIKDLKINGNDLIDIGIKEGKDIGIILNNCLEAVISGKIENEKNQILKFVQNL